MRHHEISKTMRAFMGAFQVLRKLGFAADCQRCYPRGPAS